MTQQKESLLLLRATPQMNIQAAVVATSSVNAAVQAGAAVEEVPMP
jgi:hypothetical protein